MVSGFVMCELAESYNRVSASDCSPYYYKLPSSVDPPDYFLPESPGWTGLPIQDISDLITGGLSNILVGTRRSPGLARQPDRPGNVQIDSIVFVTVVGKGSQKLKKYRKKRVDLASGKIISDNKYSLLLHVLTHIF